MRKDRTKKAITSDGETAEAFTRDAIEKLAYEFWLSRGCPDGSAEEDWIQAEQTLHSATSRAGKSAGKAGQVMKAAG
jgi:hypothetical protein